MGKDIANPPEPGAQPVEMTNASGDGRQRDRQNNQCRAFNRLGAAPGEVKTLRFEGRCDALQGHVYDCFNPRQAADEFPRTTKEIAEYTGTKYGAEVKIAIETLEITILPMPQDPPEGALVTVTRIWERRVDAYVMLESDLKKACLLVYGQCSDALRAKLESITNQSTVAATADVIGLLKNTKR